MMQQSELCLNLKYLEDLFNAQTRKESF